MRWKLSFCLLSVVGQHESSRFTFASHGALRASVCGRANCRASFFINTALRDGGKKTVTPVAFRPARFFFIPAGLWTGFTAAIRACAFTRPAYPCGGAAVGACSPLLCVASFRTRSPRNPRTLVRARSLPRTAILRSGFFL